MPSSNTEAVSPQELVVDWALNSAATSARVQPSVGWLSPSTVSTKETEKTVAGSDPLSISPLSSKAAPPLTQSVSETPGFTVARTEVSEL